MDRDLKLITEKLKAAKKMPGSNPKEYNLRLDIIRHWECEKYKLKKCIELDFAQLSKNNCVQTSRDVL